VASDERASVDFKDGLRYTYWVPTNRGHLRCVVCGTKTITRVSLVYGPYREFAFPCPECAVEIRFGVEVIVPSEQDVNNWMKATGLPVETFVPNAQYTEPLNAEWLNRHTNKEEWLREDKEIKNVEILDDTFLVAVPKQRDLSPFILATSLMDDATIDFQHSNDIRRRAASEVWPALEQLILHSHRRQWVIFDQQFLNSFGVKPPNAIADKISALYERIEQYGLLFCTDERLHNVIRERLRQCETSRIETRHLVDYYQSRKKDLSIENQIHDIRRRWARIFPAVAALYTTHYWDSAKHQLTNFTLAQKRFDELKTLYVDSFETFCRISAIAAGVEGIISLGRAVVPKAKGEFTLEDFDLFRNGSKPDVLKRLAPLDVLFVPYMDHRLRNGIGHNSAKYDVVSDEVHYVIENEKGTRAYTIPYISFCERMFNLYIQLETVSLYVNWIRLFYKSKEGNIA
jgi:hypothetical protein